MPAAPNAHGPSHADDRALVAAVRRGDDRAFEVLFARYRPRVVAFVRGMLRDDGRAEDVAQEVFLSALRRMRETEAPIAFKPWVFEIARNACIDAHRRAARTHEVSMEASGQDRPGAEAWMAGHGSGPEVEVAAKQQLDDLRGAFGGLSPVHHEILVLRELEGRSYSELGERLGLSRAGVESTLFRARRRLGEEYDELTSGRRCERVQELIATAAAGALGRGVRDRRRMARHVAHCQPCRRLALAAGVAPGPPPRRAGARVAAHLPLPAGLLARGSRSGLGGAPAHVAPALSDPGLTTAWGRLAAAALATVAAGVGAGSTVVAQRDAGAGGHERRAQAPPSGPDVAAPPGAAPPPDRGPAAPPASRARMVLEPAPAGDPAAPRTRARPLALTGPRPAAPAPPPGDERAPATTRQAAEPAGVAGLPDPADLTRAGTRALRAQTDALARRLRLAALAGQARDAGAAPPAETGPERLPAALDALGRAVGKAGP
jgi:RNA polymerase sigma factor (sigma-70 family)